jgi:hypothetical protein
MSKKTDIETRIKGLLKEYDFEGKFRALIGKTNTSTQKEIENDSEENYYRKTRSSR